MKKYYISFGSGQLKQFQLPTTINKSLLLVEVEAETENEARNIIINNTSIGTNFCTSYTEEYKNSHLLGDGFIIIQLFDLLKLENN
jgi:hypothetical protein